MLRVLLWGIGGRLGHAVTEVLKKKEDAKLVAGFDKFANASDYDVPVFNKVEDIDVDADVIIDFTRRDSIYELLPYAKAHKMAVVLCSTGHDEKDIEFINSYLDSVAIFKSSNMSIGVNLLIELVKKAAHILQNDFDVEIVEQHHNIKVDAPSGTALTIAEAIKDEMNDEKELQFGRHSMNCRRKPSEIGIHSVRGGTVVGKHDVLFLGNDEIIKVGHEASSKAVFAEGAVRAAHFLLGKEPGMYNMSDMIKLD